MLFKKAKKQEAVQVPDSPIREAAAETQEGADAPMTLFDAEPGSTYTVKGISTGDHDMNSFLFRLGCYEGEPITLLSKKRTGTVVVIKDGRYNLDVNLSKAVLV